MAKILHSTGLLTAGWIVTIVVGVVSSKILAIILEPAGFGRLGVLQSFVELSTMIAGLGIGFALIKVGANRIENNDLNGIWRLRHGATLLFWVLGAVAVITLLVGRNTFGRWIFGTAADAWSLGLMAIAVFFALASYVQSSTLNTYHRVKALAQVSTFTSIFGALSTITLVLVWHQRAIVPAVIGAAIVGWLTSRYFIRKELGSSPPRPHMVEVLGGAWTLLRTGVPYISSMAFSKGATLLLPIIIFRLLGPDSVGQYRAANAIAVTYLGFLVTAMAQDYLPRMAAISDRPAVIRELLNRQQRLVFILGIPTILGTMALVKYSLALVYTSKFSVAADILEWQLIGDIFKLISWTMSGVIVARCKPHVFFLTEATLGISTVGGTWLGIKWFGLQGIGIGFLISYILYFLVNSLIIHRNIGPVWSASNKRLMVAVMAATALIRILPFTPLANLRTTVALSLAIMAGIWSLLQIWKELFETQSLPQDRGIISSLATMRNRFNIQATRREG